MKLYIPACGHRLKLTEAWTFAVFLESRNMKFAEQRSLLKPDEVGKYCVWEGDPYRSGLAFRAYTLKVDTILEMDRVYIRQHSKSAKDVDQDYDSITFKIVGEKNSRFWVKLADCNSIVCDLESTYKQRQFETK